MVVDLELTTKNNYYIKANDLEKEGEWVDMDWMNWTNNGMDGNKEKQDCAKIKNDKSF